jgi:hypothetical protein
LGRLACKGFSLVEAEGGHARLHTFPFGGLTAFSPHLAHDLRNQIEMLGLRWEDFDWNSLRVKIQRSWVYGSVQDVKTEGSEKWLPLDTNLADILHRHREKMPDALVGTGWVLSPSACRREG